MSTKDHEVMRRRVQGASSDAGRRKPKGNDREIRRELEDPSWPNKAKKLYAMTKKKLEGLHFRGELGGAVPGGHEVEDFIQQAILKALKAKKLQQWNPRKSSLVTFLWAIIKNLIKDRLKRAENKSELRETTDHDEASAGGVDSSQFL